MSCLKTKDRTGPINWVQKHPGAQERPIVVLSDTNMTTRGSGHAAAIVSVNCDNCS